MKITAVAERVGAIAAVRADPAATADVIESGLVAGAVDEFARRLDSEAKRFQDDDGMQNLGCTTRLVSRAQRRPAAR